MKIIHAWIYDPTRPTVFKPLANARARVNTISCEGTAGCDIFEKCNSCVLTNGVFTYCPYGRKGGEEGYTKRARNYFSWIDDKRKKYSEYLKRLTPLSAFNRVFKVRDKWYLPYSHMSGDRHPIEREWVEADALTPELLAKICAFQPKDWFGGAIRKYQDEQVPKFISDLNRYYPETFALLPDDQKARLESVDYIGRKADLKTVPPGNYIFGKNSWSWDGEYLHGGSLIFPPCEGKIEIKITPNDGQSVKITSNDQVTDKTVFLD